MLTRSSLSKTVARQRVGHPVLVRRVTRARGNSANSATSLPPRHDFPHFPLPRYPSRAPTSLRRESKSPCKTVFPPFIAVFDRLFGEHESKAVDESITWPGRRFFHRFKTAKTVKTAPHRIDGASRSGVIPL